VGEENLDLEDRYNIPQKENGKMLREWIERGGYCEPFRRKYPMAQTMSYIPFRTRRRVNGEWEYTNYGKSRLDFFITSESLYNDVSSVYYGERLSRDFVHVETVLRIGKSRKSKESIYIRNETLERPDITEIGALGALDCIPTHLMVPSEELRRQLGRVGRLEQIYVEKGNIRRGMSLGLADDEDREIERLAELDREWKEVLRVIGSVQEWAAEEVSCSRSTFYEVLLNEYKNRIVSLQGAIDADRKYKRKWLLSRGKVYQEICGKNSEQCKECEEELLNHDSMKLREDTGKYIQFLRENNEKPTRKFCRLGKDINTVDDIRQIQRSGGGGG
jgi:hypothetical protein